MSTAVLQFGAFLAVGSTSALLSLLIRYLVNLVTVFEVAVIVAQIGGVLCAFSLNKLYVFPTSNNSTSMEFGRFAIVNVASLIIATSTSSLLYRFALPALGVDAPLLAHVGGLAACSVPSFFGHKFFSFRPRQPTGD